MNFAEPMLKDNALKGKTIVVTGGGTGLGKSMSTYFSQLGANVVITSRKIDVLEKTATEMRQQTGGKVLAVACDVRHEDQIHNLLKKTLDEFGAERFDVVYPAAGSDRSAVAMTLDELERCIGALDWVEVTRGWNGADAPV